MRRARGSLLVALLMLALALACAPDPRAEVPIVVGGADSLEQQLLSRLTMLYLESLGYRVNDKTNLRTPAMVRKALDAGSIDVCWEYTGVTWSDFLGHDRPISSGEELYRRIREADTDRGILWLEPSPTRHTLVLAISNRCASAYALRTISDLAQHVRKVDPDMQLCTPAELLDTATGIRGLERVYGFTFKAGLVRRIPTQQAFAELIDGYCDCALGYTTDAALADAGHWLVDDRGFVPASDLAVAVRMATLTEHPELESELAALSERLTQRAMAELLQQAGKPDARLDALAKRFLADQGLGRPRRAPGTATPAP